MSEIDIIKFLLLVVQFTFLGFQLGAGFYESKHNLSHGSVLGGVSLWGVIPVVLLMLLILVL